MTHDEMTEIEKQMLALVNEVASYECINTSDACHADLIRALRRAIEQHEQFKREVSDVVEGILKCTNANKRYGACLVLNRFILPKPVDPLVEVLAANWGTATQVDADYIRAALAKRGLEVREIEK